MIIQQIKGEVAYPPVDSAFDEEKELDKWIFQIVCLSLMERNVSLL